MVEVRGGMRPQGAVTLGSGVRVEACGGGEPGPLRAYRPVRRGRKLEGGDRENSPSSPKPPDRLLALFVTLSVYPRGCSSRRAAPSAGDDVGPAEEGADFCAVQVTGDCLITFDGHDSVDVHRAVGDLPGAGHLGR